MKKQLLILMGTILPIGLLAQTYCVPPPFYTGPFTGITNVKIGTLDHNSGDSDGVTYYDEEAAPKLGTGMTYTMSVTTNHNLIGTFSGNLNTWAWIDFNQDGDFEDAGELVYKIDDQYKGTYTEDVTIPMTAKTGTTRMRVYNDMPTYEGHEIPHPCGYSQYPSNFLGQHGESQDYDIEITSAATGISESTLAAGKFNVYMNASGLLQVSYGLNTAATVSIEVYNGLGQKIMERSTNRLQAGNHTVTLESLDQFAGQLLIVQLRAGEELQSNKIIYR